ncbi:MULTISPECIES: DUF2922 domain-containing protein [Bacillus]|uniref:DUF2922 domain-containing protein n=1 Tax=Bacillus TaxID=1386 RepID=UPI000BB94D61|nr:MULTISPECIES: DUF2922 domain-containing protein [Bacillus]
MKVLELFFVNEDGKLARLTIDEPRENMTAGELSTAMDAIVQAGVFSSTGGDFVDKHSARIVERNVQTIAIS